MTPHLGLMALLLSPQPRLPRPSPQPLLHSSRLKDRGRPRPPLTTSDTLPTNRPPHYRSPHLPTGVRRGSPSGFRFLPPRGCDRWGPNYRAPWVLGGSIPLRLGLLCASPTFHRRPAAHIADLPRSLTGPPCRAHTPRPETSLRSPRGTKPRGALLSLATLPDPATPPPPLAATQRAPRGFIPRGPLSCTTHRPETSLSLLS